MVDSILRGVEIGIGPRRTRQANKDKEKDLTSNSVRHIYYYIYKIEIFAMSEQKNPETTVVILTHPCDLRTCDVLVKPPEYDNYITYSSMSPPGTITGIITSLMSWFRIDVNL